MVKKTATACVLAAGLLIGPLGASGWAAGAADEAGAAGAAHRAGVEAAPRAAHTFGVVVSQSGVNVRSKPTTYSKVVKTLAPRQRIGLVCQKRGKWVDGNPVWYRVHGVNGWVAARYVHNLQPVRSC
ncbi:SH3 domain-containing protein [Streptomyces sp. NPDC051000]|uniref:SH3 domain-containing protein n=1 Tax=Streptomyces sp. NPDC051000 TaxID=3155520 RepID=UPI00340FD787